MKTTKMNLYEIISEETINLLLEKKEVILLNESGGALRAFLKMIRTRRADLWRERGGAGAGYTKQHADPFHPDHALLWAWPKKFRMKAWRGKAGGKRINLKERYNNKVQPTLENLQETLTQFFHKAAKATVKTEGENLILEMKTQILDKLDAVAKALRRELNILDFKINKLRDRKERPGIELTQHEEDLLKTLERTQTSYQMQHENIRMAKRALLSIVKPEEVIDVAAALKNIKGKKFEGISINKLRKKYATPGWGPEPDVAPITGGKRIMPGSLQAAAIVNRKVENVLEVVAYRDKYIPKISDLVDNWTPPKNEKGRRITDPSTGKPMTTDTRIDLIDAISNGQLTTQGMWERLRQLYIHMEDGLVVDGEVVAQVQNLLYKIKQQPKSTSVDKQIEFLNDIVNDYSQLMKDITNPAKHGIYRLNWREGAGGFAERALAKKGRTVGVQKKIDLLGLDEVQAGQLKDYIKENIIPEFRALHRAAWRTEKALRYIYQWGKEAGKEKTQAKEKWQQFNVSLNRSVAITEALRELMNIYPYGSAEYKAMLETAIYRKGFRDLWKLGNWYTYTLKKWLRRIGPALWARRAVKTKTGRGMMYAAAGTAATGAIYAFFTADQYFADCCSDEPGSPRKEYCCYPGGLGPGPGSFLTDMKIKFLKTGEGVTHLLQAGVDVFQLFKVYTYSVLGTIYAQFSDEVEQKEIDAAIETMRNEFNADELIGPVEPTLVGPDGGPCDNDPKTELPKCEFRPPPKGRAVKSPSNVDAIEYREWGRKNGEKFRFDFYRDYDVLSAAWEFVRVLRETPGEWAEEHDIKNIPLPFSMKHICQLWPQFKAWVQADVDFGRQYLLAMRLKQRVGRYEVGAPSPEGWSYKPLTIGADHDTLRKKIRACPALRKKLKK